ncbi:protein MKS1-like [Coffea eugenioides]|uniref:Protein MKS1 n=1 Tax=Coffea arabica TaxID=13443 RepID=A0A6P6UKW8_COFAR|nr:protein MKS1-like [Coffea arabica]XP_027149780.1 protein MKS1-like [Coffea eugenioides]
MTMDFSDYSSGKSPRRELQGPRPTPLKVRKDSHKIRKPPVPPQPSQPQAPPRPPVIIYTVSPKVIHANPNEFMTLVQRLTGPDSTCSSSTVVNSEVSSSSSSFQDFSGAISPAARFASIEKTKAPLGKNKPQVSENDISVVEGMELISGELERSSGLFPGILSPNPASLQPIPSTFFSPPSDPNPLGFFHDLSPVLHSNKNYAENSFLFSPSTFISPNTPNLDLFNNLFDL